MHLRTGLSLGLGLGLGHGLGLALGLGLRSVRLEGVAYGLGSCFFVCGTRARGGRGNRGGTCGGRRRRTLQ
eukprot:5688994-Lingulodinium_polyedra.AAC.1